MDNSVSSYLVVFLFASVVLASGCVSNQSSGQDNPVNTTNAAKNEVSDNSPTNSGSAEISPTSLNVPDEVEMGSEFTVEATFENTGGASGEFETTVMVKESGGQSFSATDHKIQGEVPEGEEKTYEATLNANGVSTNIISLAGTDATQEIRIVPKKVEVGEQYTTSNDIGITVQSVELADYYTYEDYMGEETIQEPDSGQQYAFINLKTRNKASNPQSLPTSYDFQLIANNRQYEGSTVLYNEPIDKGQAYEGGEVQPSIIREGYIVFTVPSDVDKEDISVVWNEMISLTEKSVYWTN